MYLWYASSLWCSAWLFVTGCGAHMNAKIYSVDHLEEFSVFSFSETKLAFVLVQVSNIHEFTEKKKEKLKPLKEEVNILCTSGCQLHIYFILKGLPLSKTIEDISIGILLL